MVKYEAIVEFLWYKKGQIITDEDLKDSKPKYLKHWLNKQFVKVIDEEVKETKEEDNDFDINNDGVVDDKDVSLMARALGSRGGKKKKPSRKKKK